MFQKWLNAPFKVDRTYKILKHFVLGALLRYQSIGANGSCLGSFKIAWLLWILLRKTYLNWRSESQVIYF